jgi:hypothetical protein
MNLFQIVNWQLEIKPEAFTIVAFKDILDRDKSKNKVVALQELAYVYHMADSLSPYASSLNEDERSARILKDVIQVKKWQPDDKVLKGIEVYKELEETVTSKFLESMKIGLSKIDNYIRTLEEADGTDIKRISDMIATSTNTVKSVRELEKLVLQDKETSDLMRGNKRKGLFMDEH